jgi:hypothetical protein
LNTNKIRHGRAITNMPRQGLPTEKVPLSMDLATAKSRKMETMSQTLGNPIGFE